jgi:hypothetical protein
MAFDPLTAGLDFAGKLLDKLFPDPAARAQAQIQLLQMQQSGELAQIAVNQEEAKNDNLFVSGWRPFIGWVCGTAFAYHFVALPIFESIATAMGYKVVMPVFNMAELTTVLMGMLGLGSLRTVEKMSDKAQMPWQK